MPPSHLVDSIHYFTESELLSFATEFAKTLPSHGLIALWGDLGAGKTTFVRRAIQAFANDHNLIVPSPTFNLIQVYELSKGEIWHCDLYRMESPDECLELGVLESMHKVLCFVEWPECMGAYLPSNRIDIHITITDETSRKIEIKNKITSLS